MSKLTERITAFFDRVAADWDEMRLVYVWLGFSDEQVSGFFAASARVPDERSA